MGAAAAPPLPPPHAAPPNPARHAKEVDLERMLKPGSGLADAARARHVIGCHVTQATKAHTARIRCARRRCGGQRAW